jgi:NRAMP (natural resistance-associated macrophage protein)-like metal ion transporter
VTTPNPPNGSRREGVAGTAAAVVRRRLPPGVRLGPLPRVKPPRIVRPTRIRLRRVAAFLAVLGPGLIAGIAGNDAGGITTYSVMGARTGYVLLWLFPLTIVVLAVVQEMAARLGTITGQGLSDLIRDWYGVRWTAFAMIVLLLANLANTVAEFAGASAAMEIFGISRLITVPVLAVGLWALVAFSSYRRLERFFLVLSLVFVTYVAAAFLVHPDGAQVISGFTRLSLNVPGVPLVEVLLLAVAVVGTTITPYMQFYLQSAVAEKGIDEEDLRYEQADAVVGSLWTNVIAVCIVLATAATLFGTGVVLTTAAQAAEALRSVAGNLSSTLFGLGLLGASVLAAIIMPISTAFVICEAFGWESGVNKPLKDAPAFFTIFTFVLGVGALVTLIPGLDLIGLIVSSQYLQGLLLPIVLVFMVLLVNNRRLMGANANGRLLNAVAIVCVGLVIVLDVTLLVASVLPVIGVHVG